MTEHTIRVHSLPCSTDNVAEVVLQPSNQHGLCVCLSVCLSVSLFLCLSACVTCLIAPFSCIHRRHYRQPMLSTQRFWRYDKDKVELDGHTPSRVYPARESETSCPQPWPEWSVRFSQIQWERVKPVGTPTTAVVYCWSCATITLKIRHTNRQTDIRPMHYTCCYGWASMINAIW